MLTWTIAYPTFPEQLSADRLQSEEVELVLGRSC